MRNLFPALGAVLVLCACSPKEDSPPAAVRASTPETPTDGAPRIVIAPDGVHVQFRQYGRGDPALVFIHGWSSDSNYWRGQVPEFSRRYTVVTVDLAGHGGTDANRSEWSVAKFGRDVATAAATVPNRQLVLIGHAMGGPVAIEAARLLEKRVIGIIGVDTFNTIGAPLPSKAQVDAIVRPFEADFIGHTRKLVTEHLFVPGQHDELANKVAYDMSLSPPQVAIPSLRALYEYDFSGALGELKVPVVAIDSDLGEPVNLARVRKVLPGFRAEVLEGTGHFLMMEDPARFNAALQAEIDTLLAAPGS